MLKLYLKFSPTTDSVVKKRIHYSFQVFCAVYGHQVVDEEDICKDTICLFYGEKESMPSNGPWIYLNPLYKKRGPEIPPPRPEISQYRDETIYLFYGIEENPDWLGEIFEWLTASYEYSIEKRDDIGRIPYEETIFSKENISPIRPYAAILMSWLNSFITKGNHSLPTSPKDEIKHIVLPSHDIDFYYTNLKDAIIRLIKNMGIGVLLWRNSSYVISNLFMLCALFFGKKVGKIFPIFSDYFKRLGFKSTIFIISKSGHKRDANYNLNDIAHDISPLVGQGFTIGTHGSYQSILENKDLRQEVGQLEDKLKNKVKANRQHWLRFNKHHQLFNTIKDAGITMDSSLGFSTAVGFRNGASFPFPPYDFNNERPFNFLEIPMILMDGSLIKDKRATLDEAIRNSYEVMDQSRKWGWGGVSILWHNPFQPTNVPKEINKIFWKLWEERKEKDEEWMPMAEFEDLIKTRYQNAGLLTKEPIDASN